MPRTQKKRGAPCNHDLKRNISGQSTLHCVISFRTLLYLLSLPTFLLPLVLYIFLYGLDDSGLPKIPSAETTSLVAADIQLSISDNQVGQIYTDVPQYYEDKISSSTREYHLQGRRVGITQPIFNLTGLTSQTLSLPYRIKDLSYNPQCWNKPIFLTMARVRSQLYWELVENFFGTMKKFGHSPCALMICINDPNCINLCMLNSFNCYNYIHSDQTAHTMEQVATVKLLYVGIALELGAHIFLLDLDVGFLRNPKLLTQDFFENNHEQLRSQMDVGYSHRKDEAHTQYTHPRPNFGCFLVKSHVMAVMAFRRAWNTYASVPIHKKRNVAIDQNVISVALKWARWRWGMNFSYFSLGFELDTRPRPIIPSEMILLDKIDDIAKKGVHHELGGLIAMREFNASIGVHGTCYESTTKLQALKASNAYWNENYYLPRRRTITKPFLYLNRDKFREEVKILAYIAFKTNRTMIIPNIFLGYDKNMTRSTYCDDPLSDSLRKKSFFCKYFTDSYLEVEHAGYQDGGYYWPSFRSISASGANVKIVEPGYYFKMEIDLNLEVPQPKVFLIDLKSSKERNKPDTIVNILLENDINDHVDRLVLGLTDGTVGSMTKEWYEKWAKSGSSSWGNPSVGGRIDLNLYVPLLSTEAKDQNSVLNNPDVQVCRTFLKKVTTKSSCFNKCKADNVKLMKL